MNTLSVAIWLPLALAASGVLCLAAAAVKRFISPQRAVDDLDLFARPVNLKALGELIDPIEEAQLRASLSASGFRRVQRQRTEAALEQFLRVLHNANLSLNCANAEFKKISKKNPATFDDHDLAITNTIRYAMEVKKCTWLAIVKSILWIVLRVDYWFFLPSPSLSDLRQSFGVDILGAYTELIGSIGQMTLTGYSPDKHERIMASL